MRLIQRVILLDGKGRLRSWSSHQSSRVCWLCGNFSGVRCAHRVSYSLSCLPELHTPFAYEYDCKSIVAARSLLLASRCGTRCDSSGGTACCWEWTRRARSWHQCACCSAARRSSSSARCSCASLAPHPLLFNPQKAATKCVPVLHLTIDHEFMIMNMNSCLIVRSFSSTLKSYP